MQQGNIKRALDNLENAGYRLRCAREYMGLSEKEVADTLKLMVAHIRAIEQNRSEYLVQRKPFERYLRAYARLVQLNPDTIVDMYFGSSEQETGQAVDIAARKEIPAQPVVTLQAANGWWSWQNFSHIGILGVGFLLIGISLAAGWGVKQLVGGSQSEAPLLVQQSAEPEPGAATSQPPAQPVELPELADIRFEKPVSDVPPVSAAELQQISSATQESNAAVAAIEPGDEAESSPSSSAAADTGKGPAAKVELQRFSVQIEKRPAIELAEVTPPAIARKPQIAVAEVAQQPPARAASKVTKPGKPAIETAEKAEPKAVATTAAGKTTGLNAGVDATPGETLSRQTETNSEVKVKQPTVAAAENQQPAKQVSSAAKAKPVPAKNLNAALAPVAVAATKKTPTVALQPLRVEAKKRPVVIPPAEIPAAEAEDLQQIVAARSDAGSFELTALPPEGANSADDASFGADLQDEATDLEAVINAADQRAEQPFEMALANNSDSASVARLALLESYKSTLRKRVYDNVKYPSYASRRNLEGKVVVSATVSRTGELLSFELAEASKYGALNRASEKAIKEAVPFPAAPDTLSGESFVLTVPVVFKAAERSVRWR